MEGSGGAEQDVLPTAPFHLMEQIAGEHGGAAAAARPAAVDVLLLQIEDETAAVGVVGHLEALLAQQLQQQLAAQLAQITGDNQVVAAGGAAGVFEVGGNGIRRRRGRSQGCTMWKMFSVKFNAYSSPEARRF